MAILLKHFFKKRRRTERMSRVKNGKLVVYYNFIVQIKSYEMIRGNKDCMT